jgi:hypothetical protein
MKTLVVKAYTNSEWDSVDVVLFELDKESIDWLKELREKVELVKGISGFNCLSIFSYGAEFLQDESGVYEDIENGFILEDDVDENNFSEPETHFDTDTIGLRGYGFFFKCYGKHTGEEFWSETIGWEILDTL